MHIGRPGIYSRWKALPREPFLSGQIPITSFEGEPQMNRLKIPKHVFLLAAYDANVYLAWIYVTTPGEKRQLVADKLGADADLLQGRATAISVSPFCVDSFSTVLFHPLEGCCSSSQQDHGCISRLCSSHSRNWRDYSTGIGDPKAHTGGRTLAAVFLAHIQMGKK